MNGRGVVANFGLRRRLVRRTLEADMIHSTGSINHAIASTLGRVGSLAALFAGGSLAVWVAMWQEMEP